MQFSQFESFYPGHVQCLITLAVRELAHDFCTVVKLNKFF